MKITVKYLLISDKIPTFEKLQTADKNTENNMGFICCLQSTFQKLWKTV